MTLVTNWSQDPRSRGELQMRAGDGQDRSRQVEITPGFWFPSADRENHAASDVEGDRPRCEGGFIVK